MDSESIAMALIAHSGDARAAAFQALKAARNKDYDEAERLLQQSKKSSVEAHKAQTELLFSEANGQKTELNVLLVHAQDHLMTSMLAQELIAEMVNLYKVKADRA